MTRAEIELMTLITEHCKQSIWPSARLPSVWECEAKCERLDDALSEVRREYIEETITATARSRDDDDDLTPF